MKNEKKILIGIRESNRERTVMFVRTVIQAVQRVIVSEHRTLRAIPFHILRLYIAPTEIEIK